MKKALLIILILLVAGCSQNCEPSYVYYGNFLGKLEFEDDCMNRCFGKYGTISHKIEIQDVSENLRYNTCYCDTNSCQSENKIYVYGDGVGECQKLGAFIVYIDSWNLKTSGILSMDIGNGFEKHIIVKKIFAGTRDMDFIVSDDVDDIQLSPGETHYFNADVRKLLTRIEKDYFITALIEYEVIETRVMLNQTGSLKGSLDLECNH